MSGGRSRDYVGVRCRASRGVGTSRRHETFPRNILEKCFRKEWWTTGKDKAISSWGSGWYWPRNQPVFAAKKEILPRGKSRVQDASLADRAAAFQKQAPTAKDTGGAYARGIERKRERKKMCPGSEKGRAEWWGQFTRETHANARPRVREEVDTPCRWFTQIAPRLPGKERQRTDAGVYWLFTWGDNSACIYVTGNES